MMLKFRVKYDLFELETAANISIAFWNEIHYINCKLILHFVSLRLIARGSRTYAKLYKIITIDVAACQDSTRKLQKSF